MTRIALGVFALVAVIQPVSAQPPPIPTGPPLVVPAAYEQPAPTWVENPAHALIPASNPGVGPNDWLHENWNPLVGCQHVSTCQFQTIDGLFLPGVTSWQFLSGSYFASSLGPTVPVLNYLPVTIRQGWMLTEPRDELAWRGNWELLLDVTGAQVISSYGNWLAGSSLLLRYNFLDHGSWLVPYHQVGVGVLLNDAYKDMRQRAIGQETEFILHYQVGLRWFVAPNLSLDIEGGYQHISNARLADRNCGINAFGGQIGVTYYFP